MAGALALILAVTQGLYRIVNVYHYPQQTFTESVGLPMTVLSGIKVNEPWALPERAKELLGLMGTDEEWAARYELGNYNSIKHVLPVSKTLYAESSPSELLGLTLRAALRAPAQAASEITELTRMVWSPFDWQHTVGPERPDNPRLPMAAEFYAYVRTFAQLLTPSRALTSLGLWLLLLFAACGLAARRDAKAVVLFLPAAAYAFGTMLLLCGPDYRFFHFITMIAAPCILVLISREHAGGEPDGDEAHKARDEQRAGEHAEGHNGQAARQPQQEGRAGEEQDDKQPIDHAEQ
jgi:hypothetical protein